MAKLTVVSREQVEAGNRSLETLLAEDPRHQDEKREREVEESQEKRRRDSEHRARKSEARRASPPSSRSRTGSSSEVV